MKNNRRTNRRIGALSRREANLREYQVKVREALLNLIEEDLEDLGLKRDELRDKGAEGADRLHKDLGSLRVTLSKAVRDKDEPALVKLVTRVASILDREGLGPQDTSVLNCWKNKEQKAQIDVDALRAKIGTET